MKTAGIIFLILAAVCLITGSTVIGGLFWLALGIFFLYKAKANAKNNNQRPLLIAAIILLAGCSNGRNRETKPAESEYAMAIREVDSMRFIRGGDKYADESATLAALAVLCPLSKNLEIIADAKIEFAYRIFLCIV
ncbi:MAG: hypothetical protein MJY60_05370 [Bacteroidales bacterium]|nr:hypothetical protein [Bacteroidales bacterium]